MTLAAGTPCTISRITLGGPAYQAGLQPGDVIERVNGYNVLGAGTDAVARIIRSVNRKM
jgi:C-terminal processing protease CtpA/Prc